MAFAAVPIRLTDQERKILEETVRTHKAESRMVLRSRIVLMAAESLGTN